MSGVYPATVTLSHILSVDANSWGGKDSPVFKTPLPRTGGKEIKAWLSKAGTGIYLKLETSQPLIIAEYSCSILNDKESAVVLHTIRPPLQNGLFPVTRPHQNLKPRIISLLHCACAVMTSLLRSSAIYTSFQPILHLISEMLVSVVVSLADQLSLEQFNIEVHAEE